jgi:hypothetical protein
MSTKVKSRVGISRNQTKGRQPEKPRTFENRGMYTSLSVKGFRSFDSLKLDGLAQINLFFGANNSGKTSILEAIYTHACGLNFTPFLAQVGLRRSEGNMTGALDLGEKLVSLFKDTSALPYEFSIAAGVEDDSASNILTVSFHPSNEIADLDPRNLGQFSGSFMTEAQTERQGTTNQLQTTGRQSQSPVRPSSAFIGRWDANLRGRSASFDISFPSVNFPSVSPFKLGNLHDIISHRPPEADIRVFSALKRYGILGDFVREISNTFPDVLNIDTIPYPDGSTSPVYIETTENRRLPIYAMGDGLRRWFYLLGNMLVTRNACHCIEEIDATFHPDSHGSLARLLVHYAGKFNNQLFMTSHSIEFTDAFLDALYGNGGQIRPNEEDPVRIFTVKRKSHRDMIEIWMLTGREAHEKREYYDLELR